MYPLDRRLLAPHVYSIFNSLRKAAAILKVSHTTVARWLATPLDKFNGSASRRSAPRKMSNQLVELVRAAVASDPFVSLRRLRNTIKETTGVQISVELARSAVRSAGLTYKKAKFFSRTPRSEDATAAFVARRDQLVAEGRPFVSLDETSFGRHAKLPRGWSPAGAPLAIPRKQARVTTVSSIAVISNAAFVARQEVVGSFNARRFADFLRSLPCPPGTVILLDNVAFHKAAEPKSVAEQRGWELLYTPPYSPWFNPIEGVFSIAKRAYYRGATVQDAYAAVQPRHLHAFVRHSMSLRAAPASVAVI